MLKSSVTDLILNIKYNRAGDNAAFIILYAVYMFLSVVLSGRGYVWVFFLFYCIFYAAVMSLISLEPGKVYSYMVPLSDKERKRNYNFRLFLHAGILSLVMLSGNIAAATIGGLERMKNNFDCVLLLNVICFLFSLNQPSVGEKSRKVRLFKWLVDYAAIGTYMFVAPTLFIEGNGGMGRGLMVNVFMPDYYYQRTGVLIAEAVVIVLQIILLVKNMSGQVLYEYSADEYVQGILLKGGRQK